MEIILKANVPHLGKMLDVVKVKDGYARNFLFPRKLAVRATKEAKLQIETNRAALEAQFQKEKAKLAQRRQEGSITTAQYEGGVQSGSIVEEGPVDVALATDMGDYIFLAVFDTMDEVTAFYDRVLAER